MSNENAISKLNEAGLFSLNKKPKAPENEKDFINELINNALFQDEDKDDSLKLDAACKTAIPHQESQASLAHKEAEKRAAHKQQLGNDLNSILRQGLND